MPSIPLDEYRQRRAQLMEALDGAVGLVFSGKGDPHAMVPYRAHPHFEYLTGVTGEHNAVLLLDPSHADERRREQLYITPIDPEMAKWDGLREEICAGMRERLGFESIYRTYALPRFLGAAARRSRKLACLMPLAGYTAPVSEDLATFRKISERTPGCQIVDKSETLAFMRSKKSPAEIAMIRRAIAITVGGFENTIKSVRPGMREFEVQERMEHTFRTLGSRRLAFPTIAGSGLRSTVLHYRANSGALEDGELICIDAGAKWGGYSADLTRTVPVNGKFSDRQREVYDVVLAALEASQAAAKAGVRLGDVDRAARDVIDAAGYGDYFIHSIGHHLGLETHDITPDAPLEAGNVLTLEPGIYIPEERIGIRIEDDVLLGEDGCENMSAALPRTADEIEAMMAAG